MLTKEYIMLGFSKESLFLNLLIITKSYIYKCKLNSKLPNIIELKCKIKWYYVLEHYIARKNDKLKFFEKYWTPMQYIFPNLV